MSRNGIGLYQVTGSTKWFFKYKDAQGKWKTKSTGRDDRKTAYNFKQDFLDQLEKENLAGQQSQWTLKAAVDSWLEYRQISAAKETHKAESKFLRRVIEIFGETKKLGTFTLPDLQRYQIARSKQTVKRTGATVHPRTVNLELKALRAILSRAGLWDRFRHYKQLKCPKSGVGQVLTPEQALALVKAVQTRPSWSVAFFASILAHATGMRGVEIKNLRLRNLKIDGTHPQLEIQRSKTDAGCRVVPLNQQALWAVRKLLERSVLCRCIDPDHYLLPLLEYLPDQATKKFNPTRPQGSWRSAWNSLKAEAGIPKNYRFHDARVSFITLMAEADQPLSVTRSIVGHIDESMTIHYERIRGRAQEIAMKALDNQPLFTIDNSIGAAPTR